MATYNYLCSDCQKAAEQVKGSPLTDEELFEVIFETTHAMEPKKKELAEARICPRCSGSNTEKTMLGVTTGPCYIRGNGYLDRSGCRRDMNLYHLQNDDPYSEYRQIGEAEDLAIRIKKDGQHKPNQTIFVPES